MRRIQVTTVARATLECRQIGIWSRGRSRKIRIIHGRRSRSEGSYKRRWKVVTVETNNLQESYMAEKKKQTKYMQVYYKDLMNEIIPVLPNIVHFSLFQQLDCHAFFLKNFHILLWHFIWDLTETSTACYEIPFGISFIRNYIA